MGLDLIDYDLLLIVVYRPPSNTLADNVALLDRLESLCHGREVLVVGDFNLPNIKWNSLNHQVGLCFPEREFFNLFTSLGLHQFVTESTFIYSDNTLDLVLSSEGDCVNNLNLLPPFPRCGHLLVVFDYLYQHLASSSTLTALAKPNVRIWSRANFDAINRELGTAGGL